MPYADPPLAGRYALLDVVGVGAMGAVWRAWDLRELRFVAVKVLRRLEAPHLLRFVREQAVRIEHPHVAAPTGWVADDDRVAFAMELARGGTVADLLDRHGPLPPWYAAELLDQLLDGLAAVHAAGVVHRDLKPANLLLDATGTRRPRLRIGDFGIAATVQEAPGIAMGTDGYAAPEQLAGAAPDPRQDLYAVGVVAHVLLGPGRRPGPLDDLVADLVAAEPARRPASAEEARRRLAASAAGAPRRTGRRPDLPDRIGAAVVPLTPARRHARPPRRRGVLVAVTVGFAASAVLGGCGTSWLLTGASWPLP